MTIEKYIHSPDGTLKIDKPWYLIPGEEGVVVNSRLLHNVGIRLVENGDPVLITKESVDRTLPITTTSNRIYFQLPKSRSRGSWVGPLVALKHVGEV